MHCDRAPPVSTDGARANPRCNNATVLDWNDLRYLVALRQGGSLARAGALAGVDKATVARRIEALEGALSARLIERLPEGYRVTDQGEQAVAAGQSIAEVVADLQASLGKGGRAEGVVRVTAPAWFCRHVLIPALPDFRAQHPGIELELLTTNVLVSMPKREADIAVRNRRATERGLASRQLGRLASTMYAARAYIARTGEPSRRADIASRHLLSYQDRVSYVPGFEWLQKCAAPVAFRASDTLALTEACVAGLGIAVLPCPVGDREPQLRRIPLGVEEETIWLVVPRELASLPAMRTTSRWLARLFEGIEQDLPRV